jgi:aerobic carbon-monoxide dehydrogenase medium subunit
MYSFDYARPASVRDAVGLLAAKPEARVLAGGQTLIGTLRMRLVQPSDLIDLSGIPELKGIRADASRITIGAMTTHAEVAASDAVRRAIPALAHLAEGIGDRQVRNMGTLGGSLANSDPAACYPAGALGLGATIVTDKRSIPADQFFTGMFETALAAGEIITAVEFPVAKRAAYVKFVQPASRFALVGVFVSDGPAGVRVAVTGAGPSAFRVKAMEDALAKQFSPDALKGLTVPPSGLNSDIHASAEYRSHLIGVIARRAVAAAM